MRWLLAVCGILLLVALGAGVWLEWRLRASLPMIAGEAVLRGLGASVTVERDAGGVPVVRAESRLDAARALGWLHGQDRFFQIDLSRRAGAGELAGMFGEFALEYDIHARFFPGRSLAEAAFDSLSSEERAVLVA